jgi:hypothetical protein
MIKALMKLGIKGMYLRIIKAIYNIPISNLILKGKKQELLALKLSMRVECPLLFYIELEFLSRIMTKAKEIKGM